MNCPRCNAIDMMPFITCWKEKRRAYNEKDTLWCPSCRSTFTAGTDMNFDFTPEQRESLMIGKPCVKCGKANFKAKRAYFLIDVCNKCGCEKQS